MLLALDFDGVLHDQATRVGRSIGEPVPGAVEHVRSLYAAGHDVVVYTCRATSESGTTAVRNWLLAHTLPSYDITALKPNADVYIDDRALHFTDWPTADAAVRAIAKGEPWPAV